MQHWHAFWHQNLCNAQFSSWPKKMTETAKKKKNHLQVLMTKQQISNSPVVY